MIPAYNGFHGNGVWLCWWLQQLPSNQRDSGTCDHELQQCDVVCDVGGAVDAATNTIVTGDVSTTQWPHWHLRSSACCVSV